MTARRVETVYESEHDDPDNLAWLTADIPASLHAEIVSRARDCGMSYDQWVSAALLRTLPRIFTDAVRSAIGDHFCAARWPRLSEPVASVRTERIEVLT